MSAALQSVSRCLPEGNFSRMNHTQLHITVQPRASHTCNFNPRVRLNRVPNVWRNNDLQTKSVNRALVVSCKKNISSDKNQ